MVIHSSGSQISKQEIRAYVLQKRRTLLPEEKQRWDEALLERLHPLFPSAGTAVYAYTSVRGEASTEYLIDELLKRGCRVALPRVFGREMRFFYVTDRSQLVAGAYGIPEPADGCQEADAPKALVITPGVGFSKDGNRIGGRRDIRQGARSCRIRRDRPGRGAARPCLWDAGHGL